MKDAKKPDLNAPRFRPSVLGTLNKSVISLLRDKIHGLNKLSDVEIKNIILTFNELLWNTVLENRDGVELPEHVGNLFIGTCKPKIRKNVDFKKSQDYLKVIQHRNWESDDYLAKIFYTNHETRYRFKNYEVWGFQGSRRFKRTLGKVYPENWKLYVQVDHTLQVSKLFRKNSYRIMKEAENTKNLESYDELALD
jgi:hypothetical protein